MKRLLLICVLSLFAMLNSVIIAQNTSDYAIWIENDQPSNEFMQYVLEKPNAGQTHTYSLYFDCDGIADDCDGIADDGKYNLKVSVERKLGDAEWTTVTTDILYDFFLQTNVPANDTSSWYHLQTDVATDGSFIYPDPDYNTFDGNNEFDYFNGHFLKSSVDPQYLIDGKSRIRFGFNWATLPFTDAADYRVKIELQERECLPEPYLCRDYEIYYDRDARLAYGGHQSINPNTVFTAYLQTLVRVPKRAAICNDDHFEIGRDENIQPYNLDATLAAYAAAEELGYENTPIKFKNTYPSYHQLCSKAIFDTVYDLTLAIHYTPEAPEALATIRFGAEATVDLAELAELEPLNDGFGYRFYTSMDAETPLANTEVTITEDATYYISEYNMARPECESPRAAVVVYLYPIPVVTIAELVDGCPKDGRNTTVTIDPTSLRGTGYDVEYTWTGVTPLVDEATAWVEVDATCDKDYTVTNQVEVTYYLGTVAYPIVSNVATETFNANDEELPIISETAIQTNLHGCRSKINEHPIITDVAGLESILEVTISDNCSDNEELVVTCTEEETENGANCNYTFVRTYTVTDECENASQIVHTINIKDTRDPRVELTGDFAIEVIPTMDGNCEYKIAAEELENIFTTYNIYDNCTNYTLANIANYLTLLSGTDVINFNEALSFSLESYPVALTLQVKDDCGNIGEAANTITLNLPEQMEITGITPNVDVTSNPCLDEDFILTSVVADGTAPYTYAWAIEGAVVGTESTLTTPLADVEPFKTTLTVTDANGCVETMDYTANVLATPSFEVGTIVANDDCVDYTGFIQIVPARDDYTYRLLKLDAGVYVSLSVAIENNVFAGLEHGTYKIVATRTETKIGEDGNVMCSSEIDAIVVGDNRVTPIITVDEIASKLIVCEGSTDGKVVVNVDPVDSLRWSNGNTNATIENLAIGSYTVIAYYNNCTATETVEITDYPTVTGGEIAATTNEICNDGVIEIQETEPAAGGDGVFTYEWSYVHGTDAPVVIAGATDISYTTDFDLEEGNYTFTRTALNVCAEVSATTAAPVIVHPTYVEPTQVVSACGTYTWPSNGRTYVCPSNVAEPEVIADTMIFHTVNGCDSTVTLLLTLTPGTIINVHSIEPETVCFGETATINFWASTAELDSIKWFKDGVQIEGDELTNTNLEAGTYTIKVYRNDCEAIADATIGTYKQLIPGAISPANATVCDNGSIKIKHVSAALWGNGPKTYTWTYSVDGVDQGICPESTLIDDLNYEWPATTPLTAGTYVFTRTATNLCGSAATATSVVVNETKETTVTHAACQTYTWAGDTYTYTKGDGTPQVFAPIEETFTTSAGCDSVVTLNLTLTPEIEVTYDSHETPCYNANDGSITFALNLGGYDAITWTKDGAAIAGNALTLDNAGAGEYVITVTRNECTANATYTLVSYDALNAGTITPSVTALTFCDDNKKGALSFTATDAVGGDNAFTYAWTYNVDGDAETVAPGIADEKTYTWPTTEEFAAGVYEFTRTATNTKCGDVSVTSATITVVINPTYNMPVEHVSACDSYTWELVDKTGNYNETYSYDAAETYPIKKSKTLETVNGCDSIVYLELTITKTPEITYTTPATICYGANNGQIEITTDAVAPYTVTWFDATDAVIAGETDLIIDNLAAGTYKVQVTKNGCASAVKSNTINSYGELEDGTITPDAGNIVEFCDNETGAITINGTSAIGGNGGFAYAWTYTLNGNVETLPGTVDGVNYTWPTGTPIEAGEYVFTRTATNATCGVIASALSETITVTINPTVAETEMLTLCADDLPYDFRGTSVNAAGTYTVIESTIHGCDAKYTLELTVDALPEITPATIAAPVCYNASAFTVATVSLGDVTATTNNGQGTVEVTTTNEVVYTPVAEDAGKTIEITITATNGMCTTAETVVSFGVLTIPEITEIALPRAVCLGEDVVIDVTASEPATMVLTAHNAADMAVIGTETYSLVLGTQTITFPATTLATANGEVVFTYTLEAGSCGVSVSKTVESTLVYNDEMRLVVMEDRTLGDDNEMSTPAETPFKFYAKVENLCGVTARHINFQFDLYKKDANGTFVQVESVEDELTIRPANGHPAAKSIVIGVDGCNNANHNYDQDVFDYDQEYEPADFYLPRANSWKYNNEKADNVSYFNSAYLLEPRVITVDFSGLEDEGEYYVHCRMYDVVNPIVNTSENCGYPGTPIGGTYTDGLINLIDERDMFITVDPAVAVPAPLGGVEEYVAEANMTVVPNPATTQIEVEVENLEGNAMFTISSITGSIVDRTNVQLNGTTLIRRDISSLQSGMYIIEVRGQKGIITRKLVVTK